MTPLPEHPAELAMAQVTTDLYTRHANPDVLQSLEQNMRKLRMLSLVFLALQNLSSNSLNFNLAGCHAQLSSGDGSGHFGAGLFSDHCLAYRQGGAVIQIKMYVEANGQFIFRQIRRTVELQSHLGYFITSSVFAITHKHRQKKGNQN